VQSVCKVSAPAPLQYVQCIQYYTLHCTCASTVCTVYTVLHYTLHLRLYSVYSVYSTTLYTAPAPLHVERDQAPPVPPPLPPSLCSMHHCLRPQRQQQQQPWSVVPAPVASSPPAFALGWTLQGSRGGMINQCAYSIAVINQCTYSIAVFNQYLRGSRAGPHPTRQHQRMHRQLPRALLLLRRMLGTVDRGRRGGGGNECSTIGSVLGAMTLPARRGRRGGGGVPLCRHNGGLVK
jgi:hypothetical protein